MKINDVTRKQQVLPKQRQSALRSISVLIFPFCWNLKANHWVVSDVLGIKLINILPWIVALPPCIGAEKVKIKWGFVWTDRWKEIASRLNWGKKTDNIDVGSYNTYRLTFLIKMHQAVTKSMFTFPVSFLAHPICVYRIPYLLA
jgi:hypothetical protein